MKAPRIYLACLWAAIALFSLYTGIAYQSAFAWQLWVALVPPLIVFVWWMVDRAALERRIRRLEARSEIGYERRVVALTDLARVERKLHEIEARVSLVENDEDEATRAGVHPREQFSIQGGSSVASVTSNNPM